MTPKVQDAIEQLHEVLKEECGSNVTACNVFISSHEYRYEVDTKSPAQLKSDGISMRNIRGEWIK
jgi:hypothetical protein